MRAASPSRVVVIGAGMAGLTAARLIADGGHVVTVLDKGRRAGGRMATRALTGGAFAEYGAQFFTVRSEAFSVAVARWLDEGSVREWCRGFPSDDGHPRYVAASGMGQLAARMTVGLDVRQSVHVDAVRKTGGRWAVTWPATRRASAGLLEANPDRVTVLGVGLALHPVTTTAAEIRDTVAALLTDEGTQSAAQGMQRDLCIFRPRQCTRPSRNRGRTIIKARRSNWRWRWSTVLTDPRDHPSRGSHP